jgi:hypothetical protein
MATGEHELVVKRCLGTSSGKSPADVVRGKGIFIHLLDGIERGEIPANTACTVSQLTLNNIPRICSCYAYPEEQGLLLSFR